MVLALSCCVGRCGLETLGVWCVLRCCVLSTGCVTYSTLACLRAGWCSAMNNFGVELFLRKFLRMGTKPTHMSLSNGAELSPYHDEFSGFVFKLQANLDPKHRDRLAYVRIVSGKFEKGMKVSHSRSKRQITLAQAQALFATVGVFEWCRVRVFFLCTSSDCACAFPVPHHHHHHHCAGPRGG